MALTVSGAVAPVAGASGFSATKWTTLTVRESDVNSPKLAKVIFGTKSGDVAPATAVDIESYQALNLVEFDQCKITVNPIVNYTILASERVVGMTAGHRVWAAYTEADPVVDSTPLVSPVNLGICAA
jgi:hypothetical protein